MNVIRGALLLVFLFIVFAMRGGSPSPSDATGTAPPVQNAPSSVREPEPNAATVSVDGPNAQRRAFLNAIEQNGGSGIDAERSLRNFEAALQDPARRRLIECLGVDVYETRPDGWKPPSEGVCRSLRRRFNVPD